MKPNFDFYGILFAAEEENKKENVNSNAPQKVKTSDELLRMTVKQLREEAATRGISACGTKSELLDRLCAHNGNVSPDSNLGNQFIVLLCGKIVLKPNV